jgi:VCBS repeat-containing protein
LRTSGQTLTDSFTYTVQDAGGLTDTAQLSVTVQGANDAPVGVADDGSAAATQTKTITATNGVLANDTDVDGGDTKTVSGVVAGTGSPVPGNVGQSIAGTYGHLTLNGDGSYRYVADNAGTLPAGAVDVFTYTVSDGLGASSRTTLSIAVSGIPTLAIIADANNDGYINSDELAGSATVAVSVGLPATAIAGNTVTLSDGSNVQTHVLTEADIAAHAWVGAVAKPAEGATLTVSATLTDAGGNVSNVASDSAMLDTTAPIAPPLSLATDSGSSATDKLSNVGRVNIAEFEAHSTWQYSTNGGTTWVTGGGTSLALGGDAARSLLVRQIDQAGNVGPAATLNYILDTTGPTLGLYFSPGQTQGSLPVLTGTISDTNGVDSVTLVLSNGTSTVTLTALVSGGVWSATSDTALSEGSWNVEIIGKDKAGNETRGSSSINVFVPEAPPPLPPPPPLSPPDNPPPGNDNPPPPLPQPQLEPLVIITPPAPIGSALVSSVTVTDLPGFTSDALLVVNAPGTVFAQAGKDASFQLPTGIFQNSDPGAETTVTATLADGQPLPGWLKFDPATGKFSGTPPDGSTEDINIRLTATDNRGHSASTEFTMKLVKPKPDAGAALDRSLERYAHLLHRPVPVGRASLADQFGHHGRVGQAQERLALLQHLHKFAATHPRSAA